VHPRRRFVPNHYYLRVKTQGPYFVLSPGLVLELLPPRASSLSSIIDPLSPRPSLLLHFNSSQNLCSKGAPQRNGFSVLNPCPLSCSSQRSRLSHPVWVDTDRHSLKSQDSTVKASQSRYSRDLGHWLLVQAFWGNIWRSLQFPSFIHSSRALSLHNHFCRVNFFLFQLKGSTTLPFI
jgi:hypothetical protein